MRDGGEALNAAEAGMRSACTSHATKARGNLAASPARSTAFSVAAAERGKNPPHHRAVHTKINGKKAKRHTYSSARRACSGAVAAAANKGAPGATVAPENPAATM